MNIEYQKTGFKIFLANYAMGKNSVPEDYNEIEIKEIYNFYLKVKLLLNK